MLRSLGYLTGGNTATRIDGPRADPKERIAIVNRLERAVELMGANRHGQAVVLLEALAVEESESSQILNRLGESLLATGQYGRAATIYRQLVQLTPEDEIPLVNLGSIAITRKEHEKAVDCFERALAINPRQVEALLNLGYLNQRVLFNRKKAKEYYRRFLEAAPNDPQAGKIRSLLDQF